MQLLAMIQRKNMTSVCAMFPQCHNMPHAYNARILCIESQFHIFPLIYIQWCLISRKKLRMEEGR